MYTKPQQLPNYIILTSKPNLSALGKSFHNAHFGEKNTSLDDGRTFDEGFAHILSKEIVTLLATQNGFSLNEIITQWKGKH